MNAHLPQLRHSKLLADAPSALMALLEAIARPQALKSGDVLFEQGDDGDALFVVEAGVLEVSILSVNGRKLTLNLLHTGDVFGEIALFDPGPRTATVTATAATQLNRISRNDLFAALKDQPALALDMVALAGRRLRWVSTQLEEHVFLPLGARLALRVLYLAEKLPTPADRIAISQSDLADHVGVTREAVSKTLAEWKRLGWIELSRGGLRIINHDAVLDLSLPEML